MMGSSESPADNPPLHDEVERFEGSPSSENPAGDTFNVTVSIPDSINIKMVDASALSDYEVWVFISSLLSSAFVGFLVAYLQAVDANSASKTYAGWVVVVFGVLFLVALATGLSKRLTLNKKGKNIQLRTTSASISKR